MKVTIERSMWLRGETKSMLRRHEDGRMCCLGFLGLACGYTAEQITDVGEPADAGMYLDGVPNLWPDTIACRSEEGFVVDRHVTDRIIGTNDDTVLDEETRERRLAELFRQAGIEVEFVP